MSDIMKKVDREIGRLVKERGLMGYSMTLSRTKDFTKEDVGEAMLLAISFIDSPNNLTPEEHKRRDG
jgi:hypothetical protein